jgi:hypothetical protein
MEWLQQVIKSVEPVQYVYGIVAVCGGIARYLSGFSQGKGFSFSIFLASAFVAGFSGWMFALMGMSLHLPQGMVFMMAGTGGFMGEQTMKFIVEWLQQRLK